MTESEWLRCTDPRTMLEYLKGPETTEMRKMFGSLVPIITYNSKRISERKARLFGVACCRQLSDLYDEVHCQRLIDYGLRSETFEGRGLVVPQADCCLKAIELAERAADEAVPEEELRTLAKAADALHHPGGDYAASHDSTDEYEHRLVATAEVAYAISFVCSDYPVRYDVFGQPSGAFDNFGGVIWNTAQAAVFRKGLAYANSIEGGDPENMAVNAELLRDVVGNPFRPLTVDPIWLTPAVVSLAQAAYDDRPLPTGHLEPDRLGVLADALEDAGCSETNILGHLRGAGTHWRGCWCLDLLLGKE